MLNQKNVILILLIFLFFVNVYCRSSLKKPPRQGFNFETTPSTNNTTGPIVTLGCSMCQQILNLTSTHYHAMDKQTLFDYINNNHCSNLGLFKNICFLTIDKYFNKLYESYASNFKLEDTNILPKFRRICTQVELCSPDETSAFCKRYYVTDTHNPLSEKANEKYNKKEL